ncbi:hypothetical protein ARMSODRAFT_209345 [Armillaria solidipes]|uniref:Secreted protein n=1 Tax=Armillaria solidipes TaxID=1076256 RepID=A0A2H3BGW8_9AGAR|nr:hypothetical protein ARMSODRAFT_209345 [Armillaria solidipes]
MSWLFNIVQLLGHAFSVFTGSEHRTNVVSQFHRGRFSQDTALASLSCCYNGPKLWHLIEVRETIDAWLLFSEISTSNSTALL